MSNDALVGLISFSVIFILEYFFPFFKFPGLRIKHALTNFTLAAVNTVIVFATAGFLALSLEFLQENFGGLSAILGLSPVTSLVITLILFDLWMYIWHRMNHEIFFLWRFHRVHHTDPEMDTTTAFRFHPIEISFSLVLEVIVFLILGVNFTLLMVYKTLMFPVVLLHHSNVAVPPKWDSLLGKVIVMPNMHRVHHSEIREETDSNYGSIFSFWDRLLGTYNERTDIGSIHYGIGAFTKAKWQNPLGLLRTPFKTLKKRTN